MEDPAFTLPKQIPDVFSIGVVGVSGATGGDKDEVCSNAGIAKVADALE